MAMKLPAINFEQNYGKERRGTYDFLTDNTFQSIFGILIE